MLELLEKFVSKNDPREYMRSPFNRGEWTYATNGHIAVRVPKIDGVEILPEKHIPALESLFQSVGGNDFIALPWMPPLEECQSFAAEPESLTSARSATGMVSLNTERTPITAKSAAVPVRSNTAAQACQPAGIVAALAQKEMHRRKLAARILTCFTFT